VNTRSLVVSVLLLGALPACASGAAPASDTEVSTEYGPVRGVRRDGVVTFEGIPYAAAPVADRRWAPPSPPEPWREPLDASEPGPSCPQANPQGGATAEDCLTVNVYSSAPTRDAAAPVLVWLHGGGFTAGRGADVEPGRFAAEHGVVVVTLNYRLGARSTSRRHCGGWTPTSAPSAAIPGQ
jgi:para-nitrobenzyl esterase